jgi:hypothetical protein
MVSKLMVGSVALIAVGLVLVVVGNPSLRFVTGTTTGTSTTFTRTFTGTFNFTGGTFPGNFTRGAGAAFAGTRGVTTAALESLAGIALVAAGLLLEIFSIFIRPRAPGVPATPPSSVPPA